MGASFALGDGVDPSIDTGVIGIGEEDMIQSPTQPVRAVTFPGSLYHSVPAQQWRPWLHCQRSRPEHTGFCLASQSRYEPQYVLWLCLLVAWSQCQSRMTFPEVCVFVFMCACFSSTSLPLQPLPLFCQRWFVFVLFLSPLPRSLSPSKLFSCVSEEATTLAHAQF